ncbi:hypothetical protein K492DRAFT_192233 [Lichtheimia hyalospora FSU 10163]|nr:hypothetical protein K492DRAFT_192233 [Lichtheimia hyalospora FSU 10163]
MAIIKFYRQQDYFIGTLNVTRQQVRQQAGLIFPTHGQYAQKTTVIVRKVVLRCICYPLIPLISKAWGVGIQIAMIKHAPVPYPIFCLDGWFSNFLGFMVSFIYFTDPSVITVVQEMWMRVKQRYVDEYYSVNVRRSKTTTGFAQHHHPPPPPHSPPTKSPRPSVSTVSDISATASSSNQSIRSFSADDAFLTMRYAQQDMQDTTIPSSARKPIRNRASSPAVPVMASELKMIERYYRSRLQGDERGEASHQRIPYLRRFTYPNVNPSHRKYRPGKIYKVVEIPDEIQLGDLSSQQQEQDHPQQEAVSSVCKCLPCYILKVGEQHMGDDNEWQQKHATLSPEDRSEIWRMSVSPVVTTDEDQLDAYLSRVSTTTGQSGWTQVKSSGYVEPYDHPKTAKLIHWFLVTVCRVKPKDNQDHVVELIELFPLKDGDMDLEASTKQKRMLNQGSIHSSQSPGESEQALQGNVKEGAGGNRDSYLSESSASTSNSSRVTTTTTSSLSYSYSMAEKSSKRKGKQVAKAKPKKHSLWHDNEREPNISHAELRPGKDMQRRSGEDDNRFLFTVTNDTGSQAHHEYISALHERDEHLSPPQRPGLLRRISGKTSPIKKESPSSFFSMWSNGSLKDKQSQHQRIPSDTSEAKSSLVTPIPAKPINTSVLDTRPHSPIETEVPSGAPSPSSNLSSRIYPHSLRARPKTQYDRKDGIPLLPSDRSVERDGVALQRVSSTLVQDFLNKHRLLAAAESTYKRSTVRENHAAAMQFVSTISFGFAQGATEAVYVSNWDHDNDGRIKTRKQSWSFDELVTKLMQPDM